MTRFNQRQLPGATKQRAAHRVQRVIEPF